MVLVIPLALLSTLRVVFDDRSGQLAAFLPEHGGEVPEEPIMQRGNSEPEDAFFCRTPARDGDHC